MTNNLVHSMDPSAVRARAVSDRMRVMDEAERADVAAMVASAKARAATATEGVDRDALHAAAVVKLTEAFGVTVK